MAKMAHGLLSGKFSIPLVNEQGEITGQNGIPPSMFKSLISKDHSEFSTMRQQVRYYSNDFFFLIC